MTTKLVSVEKADRIDNDAVNRARHTRRSVKGGKNVSFTGRSE
jgi:hypothetical protein